jgi:hypothetical protein
MTGSPGDRVQGSCLKVKWVTERLGILRSYGVLDVSL